MLKRDQLGWLRDDRLVPWLVIDGLALQSQIVGFDDRQGAILPREGAIAAVARAFDGDAGSHGDAPTSRNTAATAASRACFDPTNA